MKYKTRQRGFTIIELLIATLIFSVVMLVMLAAFIRTGDLFYKGVSMNNLQEDSRNVVQSVIDDIKFTQQPPTDFYAQINHNPTGVFCVGDHRYRYQIGQQVGTGSNYGLARDTISNNGACPRADLPPPNGLPPDNTTDVKMLDAGMQLNYLEIKCQNGRCSIDMHAVFYGGSNPDEIFSSPSNITPTSTAKDAQCTGSLSDTQLCATADYDSTVIVSG